MIYPSEADIVPLIKYMVESLRPYARANGVNLTFTSGIHELTMFYEPLSFIQPVSQLICQIISLVPHQSEVWVRLHTCPQQEQLFLEVENSGINLIPVNNLTTPNAFHSFPLANGTRYRLILPITAAGTPMKYPDENKPAQNNLPRFYAEIRKRLRSHFTQSEKLVAALSQTRPLEASFLQKINALIKSNLANEDFDTNALCKAMAMSRTQLFRRLKPLIRQAPATYIKTMRLQKAKELLETTDRTVSEVAFQCGFQTASHFTKVFQQQYGVLPSLYRRNRPATNE